MFKRVVIAGCVGTLLLSINLMGAKPAWAGGKCPDAATPKPDVLCPDLTILGYDPKGGVDDYLQFHSSKHKFFVCAPGEGDCQNNVDEWLGNAYEFTGNCQTHRALGGAIEDVEQACKADPDFAAPAQ